jgi:hypothetical protein
MSLLSIILISCKSLIVLICIAYLPSAISQSAKVNSYAHQGINAQASGNFKLACENFEIASNFAKGEDSPNYQQLLAQKNSACSQEESRLEKSRANEAKNSNTKLLETTGSLPDLISNANFYVGKRVIINCSSLYVSSSGQAISCESNGLSLWIDVNSLNNDQYKTILRNCTTVNCSVCAAGIFVKLSNRFLLSKTTIYDQMFGSCFSSRY